MRASRGAIPGDGLRMATYLPRYTHLTERVEGALLEGHGRLQLFDRVRLGRLTKHARRSESRASPESLAQD